MSDPDLISPMMYSIVTENIVNFSKIRQKNNVDGLTSSTACFQFFLISILELSNKIKAYSERIKNTLTEAFLIR